MKKCSLCKNRVHKDDLVDVNYGTLIRQICPSCNNELIESVNWRAAKIRDYAKVMKTGKKLDKMDGVILRLTE
jgi:hypothetical protein